MTGNSNDAAYNGVTPDKPSHHFSENPPTPHPADKQSLGGYRLERYEKGPDSVPLGHVQPASSGTRKENVVAELNNIISRLP
ncbi:hypothetical protein GGS26DRAFT_557705 [Hypomontagnella submonticulosa]|nr:hypothetical protein GGS26DRAFT_557705 [Hypomontagnella submonticulosa]